MAEVMLSLGSYAFSIDTAAYDQFSRSTAWRWPALARFGRGPTRHYTGKESDSITLEGTIFTERAGLGQIEAMRKLANTGEPQLLVDQYGYIHDKWCIESLTEKKSDFFQDGAPRKQVFTIKLGAYGEEG